MIERVYRTGRPEPLAGDVEPAPHACRFDGAGKCACGRVARMDGPARTSPKDAVGARLFEAEIRGRLLGEGR